MVRSLTLAGSNGRRHVFRGSKPRWLQGNRVIPESGGTKSTAVSYAAQKALVGGSSVVHRGQQRFFPAETRTLQLRLLLFSARFEVRDALLGFPIGSAVLLEYPNGRVLRQALGAGGELTLKSLPRGDYRVSVDALGISSSRPIALSGDQNVRLQVISWLDIAIVLLGLLSIALALLYIRRPSRRAAALTAALMVLAVAPPAAAASRPDPLFAYYYIWFNAGSWNRAKTDYPLLGRYSSDDRGVMEQHVDWAKQAGIDGFIVSWKSTPVLNRRLERLIEVADAKHFRLLVIYQGLDFHRAAAARESGWRGPGFFIGRFAGRPRVRGLRQASRDLVGHAEVLPRRAGGGDRAAARRASHPGLRAQRGGLPARRGAGGRERLLLGFGQPAHLSGPGREARADGRGDPRPRRHLDPFGGARLRRQRGGRHERGRSGAAVRRFARSSTPRRPRHRTPSV